MDPKARIGTTLKDKWRIDELLGTGSFASVYAATHRLGSRVAIKVLHTKVSASEEMRRRFRREGYAVNAVDHPAAVRVTDDDETEDGAPFLVMDLLKGETAEARRKNAGGTLEVGAVMFLADEVLDVLAAAHKKGIVHRDLKPENLFMASDGRVRVLDFGIARFREPGHEGSATHAGALLGSPAFMAPEQARGLPSEVDPRSDLYGLGATMFVLLSGRPVHLAQTLNQALIAVATQAAPPLASVVPGVPPAVAAVVDRALAMNKEDRWPDAGTMKEAVRRARGTLGGSTGTLPLGAMSPVMPGPGGHVETTLPDAAGGSSVIEPGPTTAPFPQRPSPQVNTAITPPDALSASPMATAPAVVSTQAPVKRPRTRPILVGASALAIGVAAIVLWTITHPGPKEVVAAGPAPEASPMSTGAAPAVTPTGTVNAADSPAPPASVGVTGGPAASSAPVVTPKTSAVPPIGKKGTSLATTPTTSTAAKPAPSASVAPSTAPLEPNLNGIPLPKSQKPTPQ